MGINECWVDFYGINNGMGKYNSFFYFQDKYNMMTFREGNM